jgi:hypothetical protein
VNKKAVHSKLTKSNKQVSDGNILELTLEIDELQELRYMSTQPHFKKILLTTVSKLEDILHTTGLKWKGTTEKGKKWSNVVADRDPHRTVKNLTSTHNKETVMSQPVRSTNFDIRKNRKKQSLAFIQRGVNIYCYEFINHHE